jgi:hypothetical protein
MKTEDDSCDKATDSDALSISAAARGASRVVADGVSRAAGKSLRVTCATFPKECKPVLREFEQATGKKNPCCFFQA